MKRLTSFLFTLFLLSALTPLFSQDVRVGSFDGTPTDAEFALTNGWKSFLLDKGACDGSRYSADVPFSFMCGDRSSREWIKADAAEIALGEWKNKTRTSTLTWRDAQTKLVCEVTLEEYEDFPAFQYTVRLRNEGEETSARVHDFKALDMRWNRADTTLPVLYRTQGSDSRNDDFMFVGEDMRKSMWTHERDVRMDSASNSAFRKALNSSLFDSDDRPSATWLPFFNYKTGPDGLIVALGWNGGWFAEFNHHGNGDTDISAGQERLDTVLYAGETIRSPLVMLMYWQGEVGHAQNMFRRFMLAHNHPQENGVPALTPICRNSWGGTPTDEHLRAIKEAVEKGFEYDCYWIDAGWYGQGKDPSPDVFHGDWGSTVGDWTVNPYRHPKTLKPIADALSEINMKFLLWFETERAVNGVPATVEHPEWYLRQSGGDARDAGAGESLLLDLGNPEARAWLTESIGKILEENNISWYREDFNMVPNPYWSNHDAADRIGMTEMRFVEGLYQFWDDLCANRPGLMIDNCASGGRRLELETLKRSIVLWRSDYNCFSYLTPEVTQSHTYGIAHWIPANSTSPFITKIDDYACRSSLSSGAVLSSYELSTLTSDIPEDFVLWLKDRVSETKRARPYFYGDFYPMTQGNWSDDAWLAYMMWRPESESGLIVAFRREKSLTSALTVDLQTVEPGKKYRIEDVDTGNVSVVSGDELIANGLTIRSSKPRESKLIYIDVVKE